MWAPFICSIWPIRAAFTSPPALIRLSFAVLLSLRGIKPFCNVHRGATDSEFGSNYRQQGLMHPYNTQSFLYNPVKWVKPAERSRAECLLLIINTFLPDTYCSLSPSWLQPNLRPPQQSGRPTIPFLSHLLLLSDLPLLC